MNLPIVSLEIAEELRELNFDWFTRYFYFYYSLTNNWNLHRWMGEGDEDFNQFGDVCRAAPYQAEVCKWLRDEHNIHWRELWFDLDFKSYEQAELVGIKKAIEILKQRKNDTNKFSTK